VIKSRPLEKVKQKFKKVLFDNNYYLTILDHINQDGNKSEKIKISEYTLNY